MRPMNSHVLIVTMKPQEETHLGVVIPSTLNLGYGVGIVIAIHDGAQLQDGTIVPCKLAVGNMVAYHANSGVEITMNDQPCRLMFESNIIAVLQEDYEEEPSGELLNIVKDEDPGGAPS